MSATSGTNRKWWMLIAMSTCGGLIMLDESVVGVALPTIRSDLAMTQTGSHWIVSIYMLVFAGLAAIGGRLGDRLGYRITLPLGAGLFGVASLVCGYAANGEMLIAARAVQGSGAAIIFPATVAMIMVVFPGNQRGMAMGTLAAVSTVFLAMGPLVGGWLTESVSWHWIFWVNIPIVAGAAMIALAALPQSGPAKKPEPLDGAGLLALIACIGTLVFGVMQGPELGWRNPIILACLAGSLVFLAIFIAVERRAQAPIINVQLFSNPRFAAGCLVMFTGQFAKITVVFFGALYLVQSLGMTPFNAGAALLIAIIGFPLLSVPVGRLADRFGPRLLVLSGLFVATAAMLWISYASGLKSYWMVAPGLFLWGMGMPFVYAPAMSAMANSVPTTNQGQVGGIAVTFRLLGGVMSAALGSSLLQGSGAFQAVFLATALLLFVSFLAAWFALPIAKDAV